LRAVFWSVRIASGVSRAPNLPRDAARPAQRDGPLEGVEHPRRLWQLRESQPSIGRPAFKIGKHWRYRRADLEEWMVRQRDVA
jgi:hypothetical protein